MREACLQDWMLKLPLASLGFLPDGLVDILAAEQQVVTEELVLAPYQSVWLTAQ